MEIISIINLMCKKTTYLLFCESIIIFLFKILYHAIISHNVNSTVIKNFELMRKNINRKFTIGVKFLFPFVFFCHCLTC